MWIRLLSEYDGHPVGRVIDVEKSVAKNLLKTELAEAAEAPAPPQVPEPVVVDDPPAAAHDPAPVEDARAQDDVETR